VGVNKQETGLNLTEWRALHPRSVIEAVINSTIQYARNKFGVEKLGGVGYCFGAKYVRRWLKGDDSGLDVGFAAHPSDLLETEIQVIAGPLSIVAGSKSVLLSVLVLHAERLRKTALDASFKCHSQIEDREHPQRKQHHTLDELVFAGAARFTVRPNLTIPQQSHARRASFCQR
jgi:dienelactone hydrolase